jgi:hypothetical protein
MRRIGVLINVVSDEQDSLGRLSGVPAGLAATGLERRRQRPDRDPRGQGAIPSAFVATAPEGPGLSLALPDKPSIAVLPFQKHER